MPPASPPSDCQWDRSLTTCRGLTLDVYAPTAAACEEECCADATCEKWEFGVGSATGCHRGGAVNCTAFSGDPALFAMGHKLGTDGLGLLPLDAPPAPPRVPGSPALPASSDGVMVSADGLRLEVVVIALVGGLMVLVCLLGGGCYYFYDGKQASESRRVTPITAAERRAALESAKAARERAVAPKVHAYPQLTTGAVLDFATADVADGDAIMHADQPPPSAGSSAGSEGLGEAGKWARTQMARARGDAARFAARGDDDLAGGDDIVDDDERPVSASNIDFLTEDTAEAAEREQRQIDLLEQEVARAKAAARTAETNARARGALADGADDDDFSQPSPPPSAPANSRPGTAASQASSSSTPPQRGMKKAPSSFLLRPKD